MGLHAFHIPLAALCALWLSPSTGLNSLESKRGLLSINWDPSVNEKIGKIITVTVLFGILSANVITANIAQHNELRPVTNGDIEIRELLKTLPKGSVVYTENNHWGHVYDVPDSIQTTSIPTLGLLLIDETIHPLATSAIKYNLSLIHI